MEHGGAGDEVVDVEDAGGVGAADGEPVDAGPLMVIVSVMSISAAPARVMVPGAPPGKSAAAKMMVSAPGRRFAATMASRNVVLSPSPLSRRLLTMKVAGAIRDSSSSGA
jgi:hypothetical protein